MVWLRGVGKKAWQCKGIRKLEGIGGVRRCKVIVICC